MKLLYLWPLAFLILIPVIIIMYLLKQRAEEHAFSSVFLWQELYRNRRSDTPWEKLKKNLLMWIQLLTLVALIAAICSPYLLKGGRDAGSVVIVIDNGGSMNAEYNQSGHSRLEEAKNQAIDYVNKLSGNTSVTLITSSDGTSNLLLANAMDQKQAVDKIRTIEPTCQTGSMDAAIDTARTMQTQMVDSSLAIVFSDQVVSLKGVTGYEVNLQTPIQNAYVDYVSYSKTEGILTVLAKITNAGTEPLSTDINLYGDETMLAVKPITLEPGESGVVYFDGIGFNGRVLCAEINAKDELMEDNRSYDVIKDEDSSAKVLLVTEANVYLEKAIAQIDGVELTKTSEIEKLDQFATENYDLYIFDCCAPDEGYSHMPKNGNVILFGTPCSSLYESAFFNEGRVVNAQKQTVTKYIEDASFGISSGYLLTVPDWAESFLETAEGSVGIIGTKGNQTVAAIGFDVHNTDLPLNVEFPILVHNLLNETISTGMISSTKIDCGKSIRISSKIDGEDAVITTPDEQTSVLNAGVASYTDTAKVGIYQVSQKQNDGSTLDAAFAVNFPNEESKDGALSVEGDTAADTEVVEGIESFLNLRNYIIIALLIMLCVEWIIYVKES